MILYCTGENWAFASCIDDPIERERNFFFADLCTLTRDLDHLFVNRLKVTIGGSS